MFNSIVIAFYFFLTLKIFREISLDGCRVTVEISFHRSKALKAFCPWRRLQPVLILSNYLWWKHICWHPSFVCPIQYNGVKSKFWKQKLWLFLSWIKYKQYNTVQYKSLTVRRFWVQNCWFRLGPFFEEFACFPYTCVGSLQVHQLPPTDQTQACQVSWWV